MRSLQSIEYLDLYRVFVLGCFLACICQILDASGANYETVDVLEDQDVREGIKTYSNWPTIPQLYINKEFIGGADIIREMYESGELTKVISGS